MWWIDVEGYPRWYWTVSDSRHTSLCDYHPSLDPVLQMSHLSPWSWHDCQAVTAEHLHSIHSLTWPLPDTPHTTNIYTSDDWTFQDSMSYNYIIQNTDINVSQTHWGELQLYIHDYEKKTTTVCLDKPTIIGQTNQPVAIWMPKYSNTGQMMNLKWWTPFIWLLYLYVTITDVSQRHHHSL